MSPKAMTFVSFETTETFILVPYMWWSSKKFPEPRKDIYLLSFECSKLYSLIISVCMHALIVAEECCLDVVH